MGSKWLNVLLIAIPLALGAWYLDSQGAYQGQLTVWIFTFALIAVIPLAALIGNLTETLEAYLGPRLGGLVGASFGNVPELAIGIALLVDAHNSASAQAIDNDFTIIRGLLIGSVINNLLFVLGSAVVLGALRNGRMRFSAESAGGFASMLALAVVGLALPTLATSLSGRTGDDIQSASMLVSVAFGIILILSYIAYVASSVFGVGARGHKPAGEEGEGATKIGRKREQSEIAAEGALVLADSPSDETEVEKIIDAESGDDSLVIQKRRELRRQHPYAVPIALVGLAAVTVATVVIAVVLVGATDDVIKNTPLTPLSVGLILFPIVCNLGEQAGAITTAWRNQMEATMSVAAGSSVQVALFVTPALVLLSFPLSTGASSLVLTLIFKPLELIVLGLVSFVYALVSLDGETTWLEGLQLLAFYAMIVAVAFLLPGP